MRKSNEGITIIELIVVIAIILIIATIIIPQAFRLRQKAKVAITKAQIFEIAEVLGIACAQVGEYPVCLADLGADSNWGGGAYFTKVPQLDPWGNSYFYGAWGSGTVYSSLTLNKKTPPEWEVLTFDVNPAGEYDMVLNISGVSSADIKLNGEDIFIPSDFDATLTSIQKTVSIQSSNTIDFLITSNPGSTMQIRIVSPEPPESVTAEGLPPLEYAGQRYNWYSVYFSGIGDIEFILGSYGRDGKSGGTGLDQDIIYKVTFGR